MFEGKSNWRKANRRATQLAAMDEKADREDAHFLSERAKVLRRGAERAPSAAEHAAAERALFAGHSGAAGINFSEYTQISVTRSGRDAEKTPTMASFHAVSAALPPFLGRNVGLLGYQAPTPIQQHAIPLALAGRDLMCCAQTGSGKTCAFLLPIAAMLNPDGPDQLKPDSVSPQAVILAPTRELAQQIEVEAQKLLHRSGHLSTCVYGGAKANAQLSELAKGVTVLVATPGRLQDFVDRGLVALSSVRFLVLDEADRMLDMGFEPQMRRIVERCGMPSKTARQTLMFSATFPPEMQKLAADFLGEYVWIAVGRVGSTTKNIEQRMVRADSSKQLKMPLLVAALAEVNGRTLVFVKKKATANWVAKQLKRAAIDGGAGIDAAEIHGDRSQSQREAALAHFKEGSVRVLVATDVAARGLDIEQVAHVINFDLGSTKDDFDSYVHRIGRTGRAGHTGIATSFYTPGFDPKSGCGPIAHDLVKFLQETGQPIPAWLPALPELAGGGGGASGGKKDAVQRDVRDHRDQVSRPMSARADLRPQTSVQASAAQRAPQQVQGGQTQGSARGGRADARDRGGRGGGGSALRLDAGVRDARRDFIARPSTAGAEQRPPAGIQASAAQRAPQQASSVGVEGAGGGPAVGRGFAQGVVVGQSGRGGGAAVAVAADRAHEDAREQREVVGRGRGRGRGDGRVLPVDASAGGSHRDSLDAARPPPTRGGDHGRGRRGAVRGGSDQAACDS